MAIEIQKHSVQTIVNSMTTAFKQYAWLLLCVAYVFLCCSFATADEDGWSSSGFQSETDSDGDAPFVLQQERQQRAEVTFKMRLTPNWFGDSSRFWYRNDLKDGLRRFLVVDANAGTRADAFDHEKLAQRKNGVRSSLEAIALTEPVRSVPVRTLSLFTLTGFGIEKATQSIEFTEV